ncbi:hypothetical protein [Arthrobacter sp. STN4]|uniref:hypothetical protein n=1 Tax=Arthrobacter sp. STN4 TaxID=2923276 RepID=UPI002119D7C8|nr:hypothetical protein [Arthrobacter sp. STN4]MCQ9162942.1 hypothetical protein [Arthrobacter sp. STN4]
MDNITPAPEARMITLAEAEGITGYDPGNFTDLAYNLGGHDDEFVPTCYLPQSDGSLREMTRDQVGFFSLSDPRLPGILMRESDAHRLVE